jgi:hypothetical protein
MNLERENIANEQAVVESNSEKTRIGGEAAGPRLLVGLRELHRRLRSIDGSPNLI